MNPWPVAHSEELKRLLADGTTYEAAVVHLNTKFGVTYTRKACIGRANRMRYVSAVPQRRAWPAPHCEKLRALVKDGLTYRDAAARLNGLFGTDYSRNACIGQLRRMGARPQRASQPPAGPAVLRQRAIDQKRAKRREAAPRLIAEQQAREREAAQTLERMRATQTPRTAACYRKHLPHLPEMTKAELRQMLTTAIQNTAAMGVS